MKKIHFILAVSLLMFACEKAEDRGDETPTAEKEATGGEEPADDEPAEAASDNRKGVVKFQIDGVTKSFDHFPAKKTMAMSFGTLAVAKPDADSTEEFSFNVTNFDVRKADLPATVKLEVVESAQAAKSPKPVMQYKSKDGVEYRKFVEITFESYEDGVVKGKIANDELPPIKPKDKDKPPVKLTDASFEFEI